MSNVSEEKMKQRLVQAGRHGISPMSSLNLNIPTSLICSMISLRRRMRMLISSRRMYQSVRGLLSREIRRVVEVETIYTRMKVVKSVKAFLHVLGLLSFCPHRSIRWLDYAYILLILDRPMTCTSTQKRLSQKVKQN